MDKQILANLNSSQVGILPTDTIYGLSGLALDKKATENIYKIKNRNKNKPLIILISSIKDLSKFKISLTAKQKIFLNTIWPGPISVILDVDNPSLYYLHRGTNSLAFRMPKYPYLKSLIKLAGPLVSTSANPEGMPVATNITQAKAYFKDSVKFYVEGGEILSSPSTLIKLGDNKIQIIRQGEYIVPHLIGWQLIR